MNDPTPLVEAALANDRRTTRNLLLEPLAHGRAVSAILRALVTPALTELGDRWARHQIDVAAEHLATRAIADAVANLRQHATPNPSLGARAVIACVDHEHHELPARIVADLLELDGWAVDFLGAATPPTDLAAFVAHTRPELVGLSATLPERATDVRLTLNRLLHLEPPPAVLVGGSQDFLKALTLTLASFPLADRVDIVHGDALDAVLAARQILANRASPPTLDRYLELLAERLQRLRRARGWSQQQLASAAQLDRTYVSAVEHARQNLTLGAVYKLASALDTTLHDLLAADTPHFGDLP